MQVGLFIVGDEILSGKRQDSHLAKFIELLGQRGMQLAWAQYLGDDRELLTARPRWPGGCGHRASRSAGRWRSTPKPVS